MVRKPLKRVLPATPIYDEVAKDFIKEHGYDPNTEYGDLFARGSHALTPADVAKIVSKRKAKNRAPVGVA